jgi:hypothetical protein
LDRVERFTRSGHLAQDGGRIALTFAGRLLLDHILGEIVVSEPIPSSLAESMLEVSAA